MLLCALAFSALLQAATDSASPTGAHNPAFARDGRLAVAIQGHLWIRSADASWTQLTSGGSWDREPSWTARGDSIVFSSNRGGAFALWTIGARGGEPASLTRGPDDGQPSVSVDGRVFFVRGRRGAGQLWVRAGDGTEQRVTRNASDESWPTVSADGRRLAYVAATDNASALHVRALDATDRDAVIVTERAIEHPVWSPDGTRLAFASAGPAPDPSAGRGGRGGASPATGGVFVTSPEGRYVNLISTTRAEPAWNPDGAHMVLVERTQDDVAYNGDPDRIGDRDAVNSFSDRGRMWTLDVPVPPDAGLARAVVATTDRAQRNADAFDQLWTRDARLYYSDSTAAERRAKWDALRTKYRPRAIASKNDDDLKDVLHDLLRERPPYRNSATGRAAVSSAHPVATAAGLEMLRKGGNVVDAAAAVSFALGVVEPDASGPGGYGQMLIFERGMQDPKLIEFMTRVPEDAGLGSPAMPADGRLSDGPGGVVNVPGTVAAMYLAWKKYGSGKVTWADVVAPAIRAAREGYVVSEGLATTLATERERFAKYESSKALFFRNGEPLHAGDTIKNADLAWTLEQIAAGGADGFYKGEVAKRLVNDLRAHGSVMKLTDMSRYYAAEREPVSGTYRGYTLYSSAPPVAGGAQLVATLNLLEHAKDPKPYAEDAATLNAMIQAWQLVPNGRGRIADPGLWPVDIAPYVNKDTAAARWRCSNAAHSIGAAAIRGDSIACGSGTRTSMLDVTNDEFNHGEPRAAGTTAFTVADADGNIVAVTQTLGTWGGNFYVSPGLGFIYNDKLGSYGSDPNAYGTRIPFARHGSTLAPTIVFRGTDSRKQPFAAVGAAGNNWITSAVYQTIVGLIDQKLDPQAALELPRFLLGGGGGGGRGGRGGAGAPEPAVSVEMEDGFSPSVMRQLEAMGYSARLISLMGELREGYGAAVRIQDGKVTAGADPRRAGAAGAIQ
jgi:gamma-glutamyltranspeptidase